MAENKVNDAPVEAPIEKGKGKAENAMDDDEEGILASRVEVRGFVEDAGDRRAVRALPRDPLAIADLPVLDLVAEAGEPASRALDGADVDLRKRLGIASGVGHFREVAVETVAARRGAGGGRDGGDLSVGRESIET